MESAMPQAEFENTRNPSRRSGMKTTAGFAGPARSRGLFLMAMTAMLTCWNSAGDFRACSTGTRAVPTTKTRKIGDTETLIILEDEIAAVPAATIAGLAVKLRVARHGLLTAIDPTEHAGGDEWCLITALADAERLAKGA